MLQKKENGRIYLGDESKGGREVVATTTAVLLIEFQNEFCSPGGKLHDSVKAVMKSNNMVKNTAALASAARKTGAQVIHVPFIYSDNNAPNSRMGIIGSMRTKEMFIRDTWGADFIQTHKPQPGDTTIKGKHGIDCFAGSNLEDLILEKGIVSQFYIVGCACNAINQSEYRMGFSRRR